MITILLAFAISQTGYPFFCSCGMQEFVELEAAFTEALGRGPVAGLVFGGFAYGGMGLLSGSSVANLNSRTVTLPSGLGWGVRLEPCVNNRKSEDARSCACSWPVQDRVTGSSRLKDLLAH